MAESERAPQLSAAAELKVRIEAERNGTPFLVYQDSEGGQALVGLEGRGPQVTIGRRADNDVALMWDPEVSRLHARLELFGAEWTLVDEGLSRNGSFVNGERITGRRRLKDGDRLCFGVTSLVYRSPSQGESKSTEVGRAGEVAVHLSDKQRRVLVALCRPLGASAFESPATNREIAAELHLSVDAVKAHLRALFESFGLEALPQNQKRARLAATALVNGIVAPHDL